MKLSIEPFWTVNKYFGIMYGQNLGWNTDISTTVNKRKYLVYVFQRFLKNTVVKATTATILWFILDQFPDFSVLTQNLMYFLIEVKNNEIVAFGGAIFLSII